MYLFIKFFILLLLVSSLYGSSSIDGKMGILRNGIANANDGEYGIIFRLLIEKLSANENIRSELKFYNKEEDIVDAFVNNNLDYIALNPIYYLKYQEVLDPLVTYYWSLRKYKQKFQQMVIIVHENGKIHSLKDLKNKTVMLQKNNSMGKIVLDKALLEEVHHPYGKYIKELSLVDTDLSAVLKVYFHKSDAALVSQSAYDVICEMNPAIKNSFKEIYHTQYLFMPVLSLVNKQTSSVLLPKMKNILQNLHHNSTGKNMFELIKMRELDILTPEDLEPLKNYYMEYLLLQKKYKEKR